MDEAEKSISFGTPLTPWGNQYDSVCSIAQKRKETRVIRSLIALALGSLFQPPPSVFFLRARPVVEGDSVDILPNAASPSYGPSPSRNFPRRHAGSSASVFAATSRMNIPRGIHRDSHGAGERAVRADSSRKSGRRNGSRK